LEGRQRAGEIVLRLGAVRRRREAAAQGFLTGPIVTAMGADPTVHDVNVRMFDVMEAHTAITRGPVLEGAPV